MMNISIVLYHNRKIQVQKVLRSCLQSDLVHKVFLIDNSKNQALKTLHNEDGRIEYIHTGANLGYGKAHNIAIKKSMEEDIAYHLALNPDVYFKEGTLESTYDYMEENPNVANVMPQVFFPDGSPQYLAKLLPTPVDLIFRRFLPFEKLKRKLIERYELRRFDHKKLVNIPNLSGCFMFLRTKVLEEVGVFDERFFMYLEDTDLNRRLHRSFKTVFYPKAAIIHEYEKGSYKSLKLLGYHIVSAIRYFNKWGWMFDNERERINKNCIKALEKEKE